MKISLVSFNQAWEDKDANKVRVLKYLELSKLKSADIVIFPEMTLTGFSMNTSHIAEERDNLETVNWFKETLRNMHISAVFGYVEKHENKSRNCLAFVSEEGQLLASYAKIHPFSYSQENLYYEGGDEISFTNYGETVIGFSICYDLRFPELFQALSKTSKVIITIANWPQKRVEHWSALLKARAIENQVFLAGVNRVGTDGNDILYEKSSYLFNPIGQKLEPFFSDGEIDIYDFDIKQVNEARKSFPVKNDRKIELYKRII